MRMLHHEGLAWLVHALERYEQIVYTKSLARDTFRWETFREDRDSSGCIYWLRVNMTGPHWLELFRKRRQLPDGSTLVVFAQRKMCTYSQCPGPDQCVHSHHKSVYAEEEF